MENLLWLRTQCASDLPEDVRRTYEQMPDLASVAVESGFDGFMTSEHHWRSDGYAPDALGLVTAVGALVRPKSIGTAVIPLAKWSTDTLAERAGLASALTGSQVWLGVGTGNHSAELTSSGWNAANSGNNTERALEELHSAVDRDGLHRVFGPPKLLLGAMTPAGVRRAARHNFGWLPDSRMTWAQLTDLHTIYRQAGGPGPVTIMREAHIGEPDDGWIDSALEDYHRFWARSWMVGLGSRGPISDRELVEDVFIVGNPATVSNRIRRLRLEFGADAVCLRLFLPTTDERNAHDDLRRWTDVLDEAESS